MSFKVSYLNQGIASECKDFKLKNFHFADNFWFLYREFPTCWLTQSAAKMTSYPAYGVKTHKVKNLEDALRHLPSRCSMRFLAFAYRSYNWFKLWKRLASIKRYSLFKSKLRSTNSNKEHLSTIGCSRHTNMPIENARQTALRITERLNSCRQMWFNLKQRRTASRWLWIS